MDLLGLHKQMTKSGPNPWRKPSKKNSYTNLAYRKLKLLYRYEISDTVSAESMALFSSQALPHFSGLFSFLSVGVRLPLFSLSLSLSVTSDPHRRGISRDSNRHFSPLMKSHCVNPCTLMAISNLEFCHSTIDAIGWGRIDDACKKSGDGAYAVFTMAATTRRDTW